MNAHENLKKKQMTFTLAIGDDENMKLSRAFVEKNKKRYNLSDWRKRRK